MTTTQIYTPSDAMHAVSLTEQRASTELLQYLLWSIKQECEPHTLYDDPIEVFREEYAEFEA